MRAAARAAGLALLNGYVATTDPPALRQTFHARPASIHPPAGFPDSISEEQSYTPGLRQRNIEVVIRLVRGTLSSGDVADANDALVDGFVEYVDDNPHAAGANTMCAVISAEDDDGWIPEWIPESIPHYSTLVTVRFEGLFGS